MTCYFVTDEKLSLLMVMLNRGNILVTISYKRTARSEIAGRGIFLGILSGASAIGSFEYSFWGGGEFESGSGFNI